MATNFRSFDTNRNNNNNGDTEKRPPSVHWLNICVDIDVEKEDGSVETVAQSLASNLPLDYLNPSAETGSDEWIQRMEGRNWFQDKLQTACASLEPGGSKEIARDGRISLVLYKRRDHEAEKAERGASKVTKKLAESIKF